jgi:DNA-binding Lrp family transcriptional regulator
MVWNMTKDNKVKEKILQILLDDSRKSFRTLASELNISTTTVSKIIKELEDEKIITGYTTLIDWHKLGYDATLCLQVSVVPEADIDKVGKALCKIPAVKQVFYTTGDTNFSAFAVCRDTEEATSLLEKLRHVSGIQRVVPHTVLKTF